MALSATAEPPQPAPPTVPAREGALPRSDALSREFESLRRDLLPEEPPAPVTSVPGQPGAPATIEVTRIPNVTLEVPVPPGYCQIDPDRSASEKTYFEVNSKMMSESGLLLVLFVDCEDLYKLVQANLESGLTSWILIFVSLDDAGQPSKIAGFRRSKFLDDIAGSLSMSQKQLDEVLQRGEQYLRGLGVHENYEARQLGVLGKDEYGVYVGMLSRVRDKNSSRFLAAIVGTTLVEGLPIGVGIYRPYESPETVKTLLVQNKNLVRGIVEKTEMRGHSSGSDLDDKVKELDSLPRVAVPASESSWDRVIHKGIVGAAVGGILGAIIGGIEWLRRRFGKKKV
jgi:hypothetical protein